MTTRSITGDEHYGNIGFGSMVQSAANAFSTARLPAIAEPDVIIRNASDSRNTLKFDIDDILVWDVKRWFPEINFKFDVTASEGVNQRVHAGLTKDNTSEASDAPTADTIADGTQAGGSGAAVTGTAGVDASAPMVGQEIPKFEQFWDFGQFSNEENATGEINMSGVNRVPLVEPAYSPYSVDGNAVHKLLTAAHYHAWTGTEGQANPLTLSLGAEVRRMSVDLEELLFDRATLFSILDALLVVQ